MYMSYSRKIRMFATRYSLDLLWRVIFLKLQYMLTEGSIGRILNISKSTISRTFQRFINNGNVNHRKCGRPRGTTLHPYEELVLLDAVLVNPSITLAELKNKIVNATGERYVLSTIWRTIRRFGFTRKKVRIRFILLIRDLTHRRRQR